MTYLYPEKFWELLGKLELEFDLFGDMDDDQVVKMIEAIEDYLVMHGIDQSGENVNDVGALCEGLLDWLVDQEETLS